MENILQWLKDFWVLISTPGSQMPISTTIAVLAVLAAVSFLLPSFVQWRAYRRKNPMDDPREKFKEKAAQKAKANTTKKKKKKKK